MKEKNETLYKLLIAALKKRSLYGDLIKEGEIKIMQKQSLFYYSVENNHSEKAKEYHTEIVELAKEKVEIESKTIQNELEIRTLENQLVDEGE